MVIDTATVSEAQVIERKLSEMGVSRFYRPIWHTLGYRRAEMLAALNAEAQVIRENWLNYGERRFANWVALQAAGDSIGVSPRQRRGGRVL